MCEIGGWKPQYFFVCLSDGRYFCSSEYFFFGSILFYMVVILLHTIFCFSKGFILCASIFLSHNRICTLVTEYMSVIAFSSSIISWHVFIYTINELFFHSSVYFFYLYSGAIMRNLLIHSFAIVFSCLLNLQYCNGKNCFIIFRSEFII